MKKPNKNGENENGKGLNIKFSDPSKSKLLVYSELGYINIDKAEYEDKNSEELIKFEKSLNKNKLEGRLSKKQISEKITVNLKTLYGSRKVYNFEVPIKSKLNLLVDKLVEEETFNAEKIKWNPKFQYRLISTNGLIKELNPLLSFAEEEIKNNFTIILASPYKLYFSETMKHQGIYVSFYS
jgi:hypothetical protein